MNLVREQGWRARRLTGWLRTAELRWLKLVVVVGVLLLAAWLGPRSSRLMIAALFALPVLGLILRLPRLQIPLLLLAAAFVPLEIGTGTGSSINVAILAVAALVCLWLAQSALQGELRLRSSPANAPWLVLVSVAALSVVAGSALWSPWVVTKGSFVLVQGAQWAIIALSAGAFWLGAHRIRDRGQLAELVGLVLLLGAAFLLLYYVPFFRSFGHRFLIAGPIFRICVVALAASFALMRPDLSRRLRLALGLLALGMVAIPYWKSGSWASGWLPSSITLLLVLTLWLWQRLRWRLTPLVAFASIGGLFFALPRMAASESYSLDTRLIAWQGLLQLLEGRWILGLGLASYWHYWRGVIGSISYFDPEIGYLHYTYDPQVNLHNNFLDVLGQMGLLGLIVLLWLFAGLGFQIWRRYATEPPGFGRSYAAAALAILGGIAVAGMLGDWFMPFVYNIGLRGFRDSFVGWMLLGAVVVLDATADAPRDASADTGG